MPIGVPRIIYSWGEELPAQWTDIYNFIFRRRMVFLMQYLDDELCNQICGLLINIHMEDRSKELEKKEMENSGLFKNSSSKGIDKSVSAFDPKGSSKQIFGKKKEISIEDLMISEEDLAIDENQMLERHTLQKISLEWLNWNSQFFNYSDEPYLFYLAELLSKDFVDDEANLFYNFPQYGKNDGEFPKFLDPSSKSTLLLTLFKNMSNSNSLGKIGNLESNSNHHFDIYSAFRLLANFTSQDSQNFQFDNSTKNLISQQFQQLNRNKINSDNSSNLISTLAQKEFLNQMSNQESQWNVSQKAIAQRQLRRSYSQENILNSKNQSKAPAYLNMINSLTPSASSGEEAYLEYRDYYRKQRERTIQEEESKKIFMIINSFGGSVGNGITVHDALQFIKAGSMTLALGVAASAASLALAGGTIGERYVTEGCHVMIHQPEGGLTGQASDIWIDSQEIMKIRLDVAEIYSLSTYRPRHKILRDLDRDFYLTATETIYYGLADEIATNEVLSSIIEETNKVWDYHDSQQQKLLESRESAVSGMDTQTQN
jgi:ATP-dependent Clp protease protease subunit